MAYRHDLRLLAIGLTVSAVALAAPAAARQPDRQEDRQRTEQQTQQPDGKTLRQVSGTVVETRRIRSGAGEQPVTIVLLETEDGQRTIAHLNRQAGPIRQGSEMTLRGRVVEIGDQRLVLQARMVAEDTGAAAAGRSAQDRTGGQGNQDRAGGQRNPDRSDGPWDEQAFAAHLFGRLDRNGNDRLTLAEWDAGIDRLFGEREAMLDPDHYDRNGDGTITRQEFRTALNRTGIFDQIDRNADGQVTRREIRLAGEVGTGSSRQAAQAPEDRTTPPGNAAQSTRNAQADQSGQGDRGGQSGDTMRAEAPQRGSAGANPASTLAYDDVGDRLYATMDVDNDNLLSRPEFDRAATLYMDGVPLDGGDYFDRWDADGDGLLDDGEFGSGIAESGLYETWDGNADGMIGADEWAGAGYQDDGIFTDDQGIFQDDDGIVADDDGLLDEGGRF